ncbi:MAG: DUF748 domain-containing protein [Opitutaceae bacterium]|nr:DUF748 domain-containing protein [Opitutaceae bacterium]
MSTRVSRLRRWAVILASAFALYNVVGFFVLPPIVRSQIVKHASAALDREVKVERVRMNPLSWTLSVHGLHVIDRDGADLASWKQIYINADPLTSLFKLEWHLSEFRLVEPRKRIVIDEKGVANVADLITKYTQPARTGDEAASSGGLPKATVDEVRIERWALEFTDRSRRTPFHTVVGPMTFTLDGFTTRPDASSPYTFAGSTDTAESFSWSGRLSASPIGSSGHIEFVGFSIPKHMPFAEHLFPGAVKTGKVSFKGDYRIALGASPVIQLENATVAVDELSVAEKDSPAALVKVGHCEVNIARADALQRTAEISKITLDGLEVYATREPGGAIDILRLLPATAPDAAAPAAAAAGPAADTGPAPTAHIAQIAVTNGRISIVDRSNSRTARLLLDQVTLTATDAGTDLDREVGLEMSARWNERGTLSASGTVRPLPTAARLRVKGAQIDLAALDPLVEPFADVRIKSGDAWFDGTVEASLPSSGKPALSWQGDFGLDSLAVCEGRGMSDLAGWKRLAFTGTTFQLDPLAVSAREIALVEPTANIALAEDGSINVLAVLRSEGAGPTAAPAAETAGGAAAPTKTSERLAAATHQKLDFDARIEAITLSGARVKVADHSFKPGFATELRDFGGSIRGLSSENLARAEVDLSGTLDGVAPLRVSGQINPLADDQYSDVTILFSNIDLLMFSPYSGRFVGQKIQKGKLRVDVAYKLSQRDLSGENKIVFDQFYLGEKVPSEEALKLPIGLALALLRDRNGQINIDVPVRGNLDDPDFKYGRVVWRTIGNIVVKAATSPFNMLGGLFGGKDLDLSYVDFASGSAALGEQATKKIEVLTKALFERPALRLELTSPPSPSTDRAGLVASKFAQMLRDEKQRLAALAAVAEATKAGTPAPASTPVVSEVAPEEVNALVASLFAQKFPAEAESGAAAAAAAGVQPIVGMAPPEPEKQPGFLRRQWRRIFGGGENSAETSAPPVPSAEVAGAAATETAPPPLTLEAMRDRLLAAVEVSDAEFLALAQARAVAIRDALLATGKIEAERVFFIDSTTVPEGASGSPDGGRVFFSLQ